MKSSTAGRSLELFYVDGRPDGMAVAQMFNWTGHVLVTPRTQLASGLSRPEASKPGVYLLLGEVDGEPCAYVGESDNLAARLKTHDLKKDWWTQVVLVTAAGDKLNKAHVRYLESRLVQEANAVGRVVLENGTAPPLPSLSEAHRADMEAFLENLLVVLPAVRVDIFVEKSRGTTAAAVVLEGSAGTQAAPAQAGTEFVLRYRKRGIQARALLASGEFIVLAGSQARLIWEGKEATPSGYEKLHAELKRSGVLVPEGEHCVFTKNYAFNSTSAAAAVVYGRQAQGTTAWRTANGDLTYKDWEAAQLAGA